MIKNLIGVVLLLMVSFTGLAQNGTIKVSSYLPKDAKKYEQETELDYEYGNGEYGKTELIIHCETNRGHYEFVLTKKVRSLERYTEYKKGGTVIEKYNFKTGQWAYAEGSKKHKDIKSAVSLAYEISDHDIYAFVLLQDHGGTVEKAVFKDFGSVVTWPEFDYKFCSVSDEDKDGKPEFYLSYFTDSDGLDTKEFKQIIYTAPVIAKAGKSFVKSKATAYYADDAENKYQVEYDANWNRLPETAKHKSSKILQEHKKENQ